MKSKMIGAIMMLVTFLIIGQSIYLAAQIDVSSAADPIIRQADAITDTTAAHITEPAAFPMIQEYMAGFLMMANKTGIEPPVSAYRLFRSPPPDVTGSYRFLDARMYRSNYLS